MADAALKLGDPAPTEAEYRDTCVLLRKHDWDLVESVTDPDATLQTSGIAGSLVEGFSKLTLIQEERGYAVYSPADFCEDVTGTPHSTTLSSLPATAPPAPVDTPHPTTPSIFPTFQPGQREYMYEGVKEMMSDSLVELGEPAPTEADYTATCTLLRKHDWDLTGYFTDPDASLQTSGIAGALLGGFKELTRVREERGVAVYSLAHFCEDVTDTPHSNFPPFSPPPGNTSGPTRIPAPIAPAFYPTFQPGERESAHQSVKDMASDSALQVGDPAPSEAEYRATCTLLRKHDWDLVDSFADPDATDRTNGLAWILVAGFKELTRVWEAAGLAVYSLAHFCEDVTDTPHSNFPPFSPPPGNTSGPTRIPAPIAPAIYPTFQPEERDFMYKGAKKMVSDAVLKVGQPAPTEAEYRATCTLLRKHDWDLVDSATDPDATDRTSGLAWMLVAGFKELTRVREERGLAVYSLAHFCEDVLEQ